MDVQLRFRYRYGAVEPGDLESFEVDGLRPKGRDPGACPALVCLTRGALGAAHADADYWGLERTLRALRGEPLEG